MKIRIRFPEKNILEVKRGHASDCEGCADARLLQKWLNLTNATLIDPCQWADGRLGRAVQQTVNLEEQ